MNARSPDAGPERRPAWSTFRAALDRVGFRPSKRFGQNFLLDENMMRAIVRDAGVEPGARVVEVGAGCGFLSLHLVRAGAEVLTVEIDPRLAQVTRELVGSEPSFRLIEGDALDGKHALNAELDGALRMMGEWQLVSNLPYSAAAPLLVLFGDHPNPPRSMTVLVQHEVALRIAANPGTKDWGPLSIRLQLDYEPSITRTVPAALFWPRPNVESAVVRLERRARTVSSTERAVLSELVTQLFQRRRQTLGRVLSEITGDRAHATEWLERAGRTSNERAEDLDLEALQRLARTRGA